VHGAWAAVRRAHIDISTRPRSNQSDFFLKRHLPQPHGDDEQVLFGVLVIEPLGGFARVASP
jgi:hypothetical protein